MLTSLKRSENAEAHTVRRDLAQAGAKLLLHWGRYDLGEGSHACTTHKISARARLCFAKSLNEHTKEKKGNEPVPHGG